MQDDRSCSRLHPGYSSVASRPSNAVRAGSPSFRPASLSVSSIFANSRRTLLNGGELFQHSEIALPKPGVRGSSPLRDAKNQVDFATSYSDWDSRHVSQKSIGKRMGSGRCEAGAIMTGPTDGEWMSAQEALDFLLSLKMHYADAVSTICTRANTGLIKARAKVFITDDKQQSDAEVPRQFWWARGDAALGQNWKVGDFETWTDHGNTHLEAFGVEFRRRDLENLRPASPTARAPPAHRPRRRKGWPGARFS